MEVSSKGVDPRLLEVIVCPDCHADLAISRGDLVCTRCHRTYPATDGIPRLLPKDLDVEHLHEEESLAQMMRHKETEPKMQFNRRQWDQSKMEFWSVIRAQLMGDARGSAECANNPAAARDGRLRIVNIGCGNDPNYVSLARTGHMVVNFELVMDMLRGLQAHYPAGHYVNGDLKNLPLRPAAFDCVISIDVIHHECDQLEGLFKSWRSLLKPGGLLFLEDPNAWGLFQMAKSVFMPRPLYRSLRSAFHKLRRSDHRPADYEFPTNVWHVKAMLQNLGFEQIRLYPQTAYPTISPGSYRLYEWLSAFDYVRRYHNYHYMLSAVRT
jgi:uncharacterized protein YbaR (Trm112 family)/ubiquinone/menaquinone biosynthesis C-methylase UbiE